MQNKKIKVFIIAGEVSGDVLGARIMREMTGAEFVGVGGENMISAGLRSLFPMSDLAVMGVIEVLANARTLTRRIRQTADAIISERPDIVLTVDAPGFAQKVIERVRKMQSGRDLIQSGLRFHHVVAPQVWAWRPGRAKKYARIFDKLYAFFDFEVPYFTKYGLDTVAVGHPVADAVNGFMKTARKKQKTSTDKIIALVPGSRMSEVKKLLPLFRDIAHRMIADGYMGYKFVIPTVETTDEYVRKNVTSWDVPVSLVGADKRYDVYSQSYMAIVTSGTVSAELAMMHIPTIVVYRMNPITTWLVRQVIRIRWASLVNILLDRGIYTEFLGPAATVDNVMSAVQQLTIPSVRNRMIKDLSMADNMWCRDNCDASALIANDIRSTLKVK